MKNYLFLASFFFLYACHESPQRSQKKTDVEKMNLKGPVKEVMVSFGAIDQDSTPFTIKKVSSNRAHENFSFNPKGMRKQVQYFNSQYERQQQFDYAYDEKGRLKETIQYYTEEYPTYQKVFSYDSTGFDEPTSWVSNDLVDHYASGYGAFLYHKNGLLSVKKVMNVAKQVNIEERYTYDDQNLLAVLERYTASERTSQTYELTYNERGLVSQKDNYYNNRFQRSIQYDYNEKDDVVSEKSYTKELQLIESMLFKYEYDSMGNWTQKIIYENDQPRYMSIREITYHHAETPQ